MHMLPLVGPKCVQLWHFLSSVAQAAQQAAEEFV
jgi:hypothetical protein